MILASRRQCGINQEPCAFLPLFLDKPWSSHHLHSDLCNIFVQRSSLLISFVSIPVISLKFSIQSPATSSAMQSARHEIQTEDTSETEPILSQPSTAERLKESSSLIEITVGSDYSLTASDPSVPEIEEDVALRADQPQCRICFDSEGEDLIAPCHCKGTQKYVHRSCLDSWRSTKEGFAFAHCTECKAKFILRANVPPDRWWLRLKFQFLVVRDHAVIFVIVQLIVAFLGVVVYKFYGEELREMFGYEEHPYGFYTVAVLAIMLVGLLYGFFIAIICGQRINERHCHVLAKQELTKEYVVEDREANRDVSELDPSHVDELRMMGIYYDQ